MTRLWRKGYELQEGEFIYCDSDLLGTLYQDEDIASSFLEYTKNTALILTPLVRFEFLRDVFLPEEVVLKEKFVNEIFDIAPNHHEIFVKLQDNAELLSKIYAHNGRTGASAIDLLLAGRAISNGPMALICTGNKKDYPGFIFDTQDIYSFETTQGNIRDFCLLRYNEDKFDKCCKKLEKVGS